MTLDELAERDLCGIPAIDLVGARFRFRGIRGINDEMAGTIIGVRTGVRNNGSIFLVLEISNHFFHQGDVIFIVPTEPGQADVRLASLNGFIEHSGFFEIFPR